MSNELENLKEEFFKSAETLGIDLRYVFFVVSKDNQMISAGQWKGMMPEQIISQLEIQQQSIIQSILEKGKSSADTFMDLKEK